MRSLRLMLTCVYLFYSASRQTMIITMEPVKVPIYQAYCVLTMVKEHCLRLN